MREKGEITRLKFIAGCFQVMGFLISKQDVNIQIFSIRTCLLIIWIKHQILNTYQ
jgi:hypothetical protein